MLDTAGFAQSGVPAGDGPHTGSPPHTVSVEPHSSWLHLLETAGYTRPDTTALFPLALGSNGLQLPCDLSSQAASYPSLVLFRHSQECVQWDLLTKISWCEFYLLKFFLMLMLGLQMSPKPESHQHIFDCELQVPWWCQSWPWLEGAWLLLVTSPEILPLDKLRWASWPTCVTD